jgi:hypothetical protein
MEEEKTDGDSPPFTHFRDSVTQNGLLSRFLPAQSGANRLLRWPTVPSVTPVEPWSSGISASSFCRSRRPWMFGAHTFQAIFCIDYSCCPIARPNNVFVMDGQWRVKSLWFSCRDSRHKARNPVGLY